MKHLLLITLLIGTQIGLANDLNLPSSLFGKWTKASRQEFKESITFSENLEITREYFRQVGRDGERIPYPTVCRYVVLGKITEFSRPTKEVSDFYFETGKPYPDHLLEYQVKKYELVKDPQNFVHCQEFINQNNDLIRFAKDGQFASFPLKTPSDHVLLDVWTSDVFLKE